MSYKQKKEALKNVKKLKGSNIFINEDFCSETMQHMKQKWRSDSFFLVISQWLWRGEEIAMINSKHYSLKVSFAIIWTIMAPNTTFKSLNFNPFVVKDPDVNFLHNNVSPLDTDYISPANFSENLKDFKENSVLHLNIRSLN